MIKIKTWYILLIFISYANPSISRVNYNTSEKLKVNDEDEIVYQKYREIDIALKRIAKSGIKMILPYIIEANEYLNMSSSCTRDMFQLISGIKMLKTSALRILDATGKVPEGLMTGNMNSLGDFDECMQTSVLSKNGDIKFKGKYCMLHLRTLLPRRKGILTVTSGVKDLIEATKNASEAVQFLSTVVQVFYENVSKFGLCIPSGCTVEDIDKILKYIGDKIYIKGTVAYCESEEDTPIFLGKVISICAFSLIGIFVVIGSILEYYSKEKNIIFQNRAAKFLLCFSLLTNFPKVISTRVTDQSLSCLNGVRSLSLFYIILCHQYYCQGKIQVQGHLFRYTYEVPEFFMQVVSNGFLTTEVFFFVGGLVNSYTRLKMKENSKRAVSWIQIIIHRLWRIYPPYLFSILLVFFLSDSHGPVRTDVKENYVDICKTRWWQNILFINNFFVQETTCMVHSWYIAADMQLFLISLVTLPVLLRNAKKGIILHLAVLLFGIVCAAGWAWHKNIPPSIIAYRFNIEALNRLWNAYATIIPHIAPYFTGIIVGYILFAWKDLKISKTFQLIGWPVATLIFISMLFMTKIWNSGADYTIAESAIYFSFSRFLYTLAVAWMVICCATGCGGVINYILSLKIWIPVSRISYMVYLVSLLLQLFYYANLRMVIDSHRMTTIWRYFGDVGISCLLGLAMVATIESPFIALEKLIFTKKLPKNNFELGIEVRDISQNHVNNLNTREVKNNLQKTFINIHLKQ